MCNNGVGDSRVIRVLYVSPVGERGGAEVVLLNILKYHDRRRFSPMICLLKVGPLAEEVRRLGIEPLLISTGRFRNAAGTLKTVGEIRRLIRNETVDIIFSNMAMGHLYGGLAALGTRVKRVWFQHTVPSTDPVDWLAGLVPADWLYLNSQASLRAFRRLHPRAKSVQVLYPGIDTVSLALDAGKSSILRLQFGIPDDALVVAMAGRFQRGKGQHIFIEAAASVCRERPDARFVLIGDTALGLEPEYKAELEGLVKRHALSGSVIFTGWRNDVSALLSEVDVLVNPATAPESFGLVVLEAFLQGKPVVASRQGGMMETITDGETGFLVPPGEVNTLVEKILLLLRNESLRRRMGGRGRQIVLERFTMTRMIAELEGSYSKLVNARPNGAGRIPNNVIT